MSDKKHYVALDHFHQTGLGTVGPKSAPFTLADHDAKVLVENGLVKETSKRPAAVKADKPAAITSDNVVKEPASKDGAKDLKAAPDNKKRILGKSTK
jgi:cytochrome oxidase assembly protein ShyY1